MTSSVWAQTAVKPFDLDTLTLNPGAQQSLLLDTGEALPKGALRLLVAGQYQHDPLVYYVAGQPIGAVVSERVTAHLGAAYGVTSWFGLGLQVPIVLKQSGDDLQAQGIAPVTSTVLGAPLVQAQFAILHQSVSTPLDLGLVTGLTFPLGSSGGLSRDSGAGIAFLPKLGLGHSFGSTIRLGAEVGAELRRSVVLSSFAQQTSDEVGSMITTGVMASTLGDGLRGELTVRMLVPLSRTEAAAEVLVGARYPLLKNAVELFALAGPGFGRMPGIPNFRALAGLAWTPNFSTPVAAAAPLAQETATGTEAPVDDSPVANAIPAVVELDTDGDGVPDSIDKCPTVKGDADNQGCPKAEQPRVVFEGNRIAIKDTIHFAIGKADVLADSFATLKQVAEVIKAHPELKSVDVNGYTDDHGLLQSNIVLSQKRADAVRAFIVKQGVEDRLLRAKGFGPDQPIASNLTPAGREQNRRVEFMSIQ